MRGSDRPCARARRRRLAGVPGAVLGAVVAAAALGGCTAPSDADAPSDGVDSPATSVSLVQSRLDISRGIMSIEVHNDEDEPVQVTSASYVDPRFADAARWSGDSQIAADSTLALRVEVPRPSCDTDAAAASGTARIELTTTEGTTTVEQPVDDRFGFVAASTGAACFAEQVADTATVELADVSTRSTAAGEVAVVEIVVTAHGDDAIRLGSVDSTVLFRSASGRAGWTLDATVEPGESATFELDAVPARCDAHALAEDKVGTRFSTRVSLEGDEPVAGDLTLAASTTQRGELYDYYATRCGLAS